MIIKATLPALDGQGSRGRTGVLGRLARPRRRSECGGCRPVTRLAVQVARLRRDVAAMLVEFEGAGR
jgi:hypothetical protein